MEIIRAHKPDDRWLKASVIGSYWAAFEIVAGSFLHNLKVPLSGTILASAGVFLLVSFVAVWKQKGLVWRAGAICALLKSISPSAIILGPMTGIMAEALLLELSICLLGRNLLGFLTGGALAVFSALLHKAVTLLIVYGLNLIKILEALYVFAVRQAGIPNLQPGKLILLIVVLYLLTGALAALAAYLMASHSLENCGVSPEKKRLFLETESTLFDGKHEHGYSLWLLMINIAAVPMALYLVNMAPAGLAVLAVTAYFVFVLTRYRNSTRHLKKVNFWVQFVLITLIAAFLLNGLAGGEYFNFEGLKTGLIMNLRAAIILAGFSAISVELKNPVIRAVTMRKGMAELYQSVNLAFSSLPAIFRMLPGARGIFRNPLKAFSGLFCYSQDLLSLFERQISNRPEIIVVSGQLHGGKTTYVTRVARELKSSGFSVTGFLAPAVRENGNRVGFDLINIATGERTLLCREKGIEGIKYGRFIFHQNGLDTGNEILSPENLDGNQLVIIDEIGPLEMNRQGWWKAVTELAETGKPQLWVVRSNLVQAAASNWKVGNVYVFDIEKDADGEVAGFVKDLLQKEKNLSSFRTASG